MDKKFKLSAHIGYLFTDLPLEHRFAAAAEAGFQAVEHPAPYSLDAASVARLLHDNGLVFSQFALPMGDPRKGEKGFACLPGRETEFREALDLALDYAQTVGCAAIHSMSGIVAGETPRETLSNIYQKNLSYAAEECEKRGIRLLIEAISSGVPGYFLNDMRKAIAAIQEIGNNNISLLFDTFHACTTGLDPVAFFSANWRQIGHVHIADYPGRHEPGTGQIDFVGLFAAIKASDYDGFVGCEYVPLNGTAEGLAWRDPFGGGSEGIAAEGL
jgi:hydroxypyruvate isomerase